MFRSIEDVKRANTEAGYHWFEPATLRFFASRVGGTLYGGRYFVTSEQFRGFRGCPDGARRYSVREAKADGQIDTVGEFQAYATRKQAIGAIAGLMARDSALGALRYEEIKARHSGAFDAADYYRQLADAFERIGQGYSRVEAPAHVGWM